jgi:hypothetical protein
VIQIVAVVPLRVVCQACEHIEQLNVNIVDLAVMTFTCPNCGPLAVDIGAAEHWPGTEKARLRQRKRGGWSTIRAHPKNMD